MHCARQLPGHCEGIGDCVAALEDQDAARAYARAASGPASMLISDTSSPVLPGAPAEHPSRAPS
jgi:hypothetical protein